MTTKELLSPEEQIDGFWKTLPFCYSIETREELEKKALDTWDPPNPLLVALHYMWKRDVKRANTTLKEQIEIMKNCQNCLHYDVSISDAPCCNCSLNKNNRRKPNCENLWILTESKKGDENNDR